MRLNRIVHYLRYLRKNQRSLFEESKKDGEVEDLLLQENFQTAFQPILTLAEGKTIGFEVLNRPNSTPIFPTTEEFYTYIGKSNNVFRIAVDDAGTGYNSLKTIISLKPEFIKLDKSLIRDIHNQPAQQQLVELLLEFAVQSNTKVIAEGIENCLELSFLKNLGIHFGQGYALGRPKPELISGHAPSC